MPLSDHYYFLLQSDTILNAYKCQCLSRHFFLPLVQHYNIDKRSRYIHDLVFIHHSATGRDRHAFASNSSRSTESIRKHMRDGIAAILSLLSLIIITVSAFKCSVDVG